MRQNKEQREGENERDRMRGKKNEGERGKE